MPSAKRPPRRAVPAGTRTVAKQSQTHKLTFQRTPATAPASGSVLQELVLKIDGKPAGHCRWFLPDDGGVVQVLEIFIEPAWQRQGFGGQLLERVVAEANAVCRSREVPLRRLWFALGQQSHLLLRAFLTRHGYHHSATIPNIAAGEDLLVYHRSYD